MSDDLTRAIAEAIDEHKYELSGVCACGVDLDPDRDKWGKYKAIWRAHLAAALAPLIEARVREARAEALTDAADAWTQGAWASTPRHKDRVADRMAASQYAGDWLRERAEDVRRGREDA